MNKSNTDTLQNAGYIVFVVAGLSFPLVVFSIKKRSLNGFFLSVLLILIFIVIGAWLISPTINVSPTTTKLMVNTEIDPIMEARILVLVMGIAFALLIVAIISYIQTRIHNLSRRKVRVFLYVFFGLIVFFLFLQVFGDAIGEGIKERRFNSVKKIGTVKAKNFEQTWQGGEDITYYRKYYVYLADDPYGTFAYQIPRYIYDVLSTGQKIEINYDPDLNYVVSLRILEAAGN